MPFDAKRLVILDQIDSTNNYAMEMVQLGELAHGDAVFALDQTAGKGRMGRTWRSERGANLILTLVVQMQWLPVVDQFRLSAA
ncbi:MAG: biotin--[acetyl-CoA-carboxylase] ligase, partial [Bacteroidota bacterium]|nr:biotin--[acetyl-CoA-carboxylase] ligase [Bacteroidota bacterium]